MLLREYLLLYLGRIAPQEAQAWLGDMYQRRRVDASRDLLAFWQPARSEDGVQQGQLIGYAVLRPTPLELAAGPATYVNGLQEAARRALHDFGLPAQPRPGGPGLELRGRRIAAVQVSLTGGVVVGKVLVEVCGEERPEAVSMAQLLEGPVEMRRVRNAIAYHFEELLGYQPAAVHPVAHEESLRPKL